MSTNRKPRKILEKPKMAQLRGDEAQGREGLELQLQLIPARLLSAIRGCVMGGSVSFDALHFVVY